MSGAATTANDPAADPASPPASDPRVRVAGRGVQRDPVPIRLVSGSQEDDSLRAILIAGVLVVLLIGSFAFVFRGAAGRLRSDRTRRLTEPRRERAYAGSAPGRSRG